MLPAAADRGRAEVTRAITYIKHAADLLAGHVASKALRPPQACSTVLPIEVCRVELLIGIEVDADRAAG